MKIKNIAGLISLLFLLLIAVSSAATDTAKKSKFHRAKKPIKGEYIVLMRGDLLSKDTQLAARASASADSLAAKYRGKIKSKLQHSNLAFAAHMAEADAIALSDDPEVVLVEENAVARLFDVQLNPPWGLDRIDQKNLPLNSAFDDNDNQGEGIHIYIIDTGIVSHPEFSGRLGWSVSHVNDEYYPSAFDGNGHGTHVAGTAAGSTVGVAKKSTIHAIKVFDKLGMSDSWTISQGIASVPANKSSVVNMSFYTDSDIFVETYMNSLANAGVLFVIAAGNFSQSANSLTPANFSRGLTVGATTSSDYRASFSNYGSVVDLFAPGVDIYSASRTGYYTYMNGTSMAAPHVAGLAAIYRSLYPNLTPEQVVGALVSHATPDKVLDQGPNTTRRLAYLPHIDIPSWTTLDGGAIDIDVGGTNQPWLIGTDLDEANNFGIYRWNGIYWHKVDGGAVRVSVGPDGKPWVVNVWGGIYRRENDTIGWVTMPGSATDLDVGSNGVVWMIDNTLDPQNNYGIAKWNGSGWIPVDGGARRIAVSGTGVPWVINVEGNIFRRDTDTVGWIQIPGSGIDICSGADGSIWLVSSEVENGENVIKRWNGSGWETPEYAGSVPNRPGVSTAVSADGNTRWVIKADCSIHKLQ